MSQSFDAIYSNGVFRPEQPVNIPEGARVSLTIDAGAVDVDVMRDLGDLLDVDALTSCCQQAGQALSLEEVRAELSAVRGSIAQVISADRDER